MQEDLVCKNQGSMADNGKRGQPAASPLSTAQENIVLSLSVPLVWLVLTDPPNHRQHHASLGLNDRNHHD